MLRAPFGSWRFCSWLRRCSASGRARVESFTIDDVVLEEDLAHAIDSRRFRVGLGVRDDEPLTALSAEDLALQVARADLMLVTCRVGGAQHVPDSVISPERSTRSNAVVSAPCGTASWDTRLRSNVVEGHADRSFLQNATSGQQSVGNAPDCFVDACVLE